MSCNNNSSEINQIFVIEPLSITGGNPTLTACTTLYTNMVESCSGNTRIFMGTGVISFDGNIYTNNNLSASTINASTYFSGGTTLIDIINLTNITGGTFDNSTDTLRLDKVNGTSISVTGLTDYYTTGATLIGNVVYFNRNDQLSAYTADLSGLDLYDTFVTGITFNDNQIIITRNDNVNMGVFVNTFTGLTITGLLTASSLSANTLSATSIWANTISGNSISGVTLHGDGKNITGLAYVTGATTDNAAHKYTFTNSTGSTFDVNGLIDIRVTGGTYNSNTGIATLSNNTGGTFNISGFYTNSDDVFVTGGTFNTITDTIVFTNNTGGTFTVTGITDYYTTGGTFTTANKTLKYTRNDNVNISVILPFRLLLNTSATTSGSVYNTIDTITGLTNNHNSFITSYVTAYKDNIDYGFWKRTLGVNTTAGVTTIIGENSDFDRLSSGMTPNNVVYLPSGTDILIKISGETAKNYTWTSNWEVII